MHFDTVYIIAIVAFTIWLLLLLIVVSRVHSLGQRITRLAAILSEFENLDKNTKLQEQKLRETIKQASSAADA